MDRYNLTKDIVSQLTSKATGSYRPQNEIRIEKQEVNTPQKHHLLVVFTGTNVGVEEAIRELVKAKNYGFTFDIAVSFTGMHVNNVDRLKSVLQPRKVFTEEDWIEFGSILENSDGIIAPMITQDTTAKLSLGIQDDFISTLLWQALWHGKPLLMDFENVVAYRGTKAHNPMLQQIMDDYVSKLQKMGVTRVHRKSYVVDMLNIFSNDYKKTTSYDDTRKMIEEPLNRQEIKQTIITEKDLLNMSSNTKELTIPSKTIVTPLAYDTAKELGIKIVKK